MDASLRRSFDQGTRVAIDLDSSLECSALLPSFGIGLGSGSDYLGFDQLVGSSNADLRYTYNSVAQGNVDSYPLYHTSYEVFSMMEKFVDPDFTVMTVRLTDVGS